jgi:hypothetical protein
MQRQDIVGVAPLLVMELQIQWPFLFEPKWLVQHLEQLLGFNILDKM